MFRHDEWKDKADTLFTVLIHQFECRVVVLHLQLFFYKIKNRPQW